MKQEHPFGYPEARPWTPPTRAPARPGLVAPSATLHAKAPSPLWQGPAKVTKLVTTKIVTLRQPARDPRSLERDRLLASLLTAKGRLAITQADAALTAAGHQLPAEQAPWLQLLEHADEARLREAIASLGAILSTEPVEHRPILEQRLRRLEESAGELETRQCASSLRRQIR